MDDTKPEPAAWGLSELDVQGDLQRQPHLFMRLAENALSIADSLRGNYFANTSRFVANLRSTITLAAQGRREPIIQVHEVGDISWQDVQNEVVTFIDGGVGQAQFAGRMPILLRVGSYRVRTGDHRLSEREQFGYYPVILGDLEGGSKERKDFIDIVRITAELLAGLAVLDRTPDLRLLMFHGPLVYHVGAYAGHAPFTEHDIDLFLQQYADDPAHGAAIKSAFLREARLDIYPRMTENSDDWYRRRLFEPLAFMSFLFRRLLAEAKRRAPVPLIVGVVERGASREFCERVLLERVFRGLRDKDRSEYFNELYGRGDLTTPRAVLDRLGYTDTLLLGMLLRPGQYAEPWEIAKYEGLRRGDIVLPGVPGEQSVRFDALTPGAHGFPRVIGSYLHVANTTEPVRVEVFAELAEDQLVEAMRHVFLYARLLPGYGFPVGLDIADKFAHVPTWLTDAYSKLIRFHLNVSLQQGEISDAEMRRILVQAIYMTHRDWLFRPDV